MQTLAAARGVTDALFRLIRPDSFYERPIPERHRILFYLGHLEAFDWNLVAGALDRGPIDASLDRLFAFGIDPPPGQLPQDQPADWPAVEEVERYCRRVREAIDAIELPEQLWHVAVEHRLMHAETFAYILHQLPYERKMGGAEGQPLPYGRGSDAFANTDVIRERESRGEPSRDREGAVAAMIDIAAGAARLGRAPGEGFGWDNEFDAHVVNVAAFAIGRNKVTNGEYLEFVREGAEAPFFWVERDGVWFYRGMWEEIPLPLDWPVYCTHEEASAYAASRGMRLPTEAEWHRAACGSAVSRNVDFASWDPIPVDEGAPGIQQMIGNGWEWTSTVFAPFAGFRPFPFYPNYSEPFFDGRHYVLKGASPRTAGCFLRPSFRNWFRPSYPYLYATFRVAQS